MIEKGLIWSYGGGTQSVAIAVLVASGELPKPDRVVIADTGREATETWEYTNEHVNPLLGTVGLEVEIAPHTLSTVDLYGKNGDLLLPMFTGEGGKLPTLCSNEWKKRVVSRWCRAQGYGPSNPARMWLGISVDELERAKPSGVDWLEYHWPLLLDRPTRRDECVSLVKRYGLPEPPRSACWMCPHRNNAEWQQLRDNYPGDFEKAKALEEFVQDLDEHSDGMYLHRQMVALGNADIDGQNRDLFDECDSGFCFT